MTRERLDTVLYWLLAAGAIAVALWAQAGWNNYAVRLLTYSGLYVILVVSLNIVNGFVGIFSLGHIGFMAVGAYVSALATYPLARRPATFPTLPEWFQSLALPYPVALLLGGAAAALVAAVIGFPLLRLRGHYLALGSLALLVIVEQLAVNLHPVTRGSRGLAGIPMLTTPLWVWAVAVVVVYVAARIKSSGFGLLLGAIRLDDVAAAASGVRLTRYKMSAFVVSAFFAGVAGGLWAHLVGVIAPSVFSYDLTFRVIVMLIIGGLGSITGSVVGALGLFLLPEAFTYLEGAGTHGLSQLLLAVVLVLVMIFRPNGLLGRRELSLARARDGAGPGGRLGARTTGADRPNPDDA